MARMKKLSSLTLLLFVSTLAFGEENEGKVCAVHTKSTKTYENDLKECVKGDVLSFDFYKTSSTFVHTDLAARACELETVRFSMRGGICVYRGSLREIRSESLTLKRDK